MKGHKEKLNMEKRIKKSPPAEITEKICREMRSPDFPNKNIGLGENPTAEEKLKYEICQTIARYKRENNLTEGELENKIGANSQYTHAILYGWIQQLDLRQLLSYLEKISWPWQIRIITEAEERKAILK